MTSYYLNASDDSTIFEIDGKISSEKIKRIIDIIVEADKEKYYVKDDVLYIPQSYFDLDAESIINNIIEISSEALLNTLGTVTGIVVNCTEDFFDKLSELEEVISLKWDMFRITKCVIPNEIQINGVIFKKMENFNV